MDQVDVAGQPRGAQRHLAALQEAGKPLPAQDGDPAAARRWLPAGPSEVLEVDVRQALGERYGDLLVGPVTSVHRMTGQQQRPRHGTPPSYLNPRRAIADM